jgi:hypothetical protein
MTAVHEEELVHPTQASRVRLRVDPSREEALARVRARAAELQGQSYRPRPLPAA